MRPTFAAIDGHTRLEIQDLLSRFCHALDHNAVAAWLELFPPEASINAPRLGHFTGHGEIGTIPGMVHTIGAGAWRHLLNNIYMEQIPGSRDLRIEAYLLATDWRKSGNIVRCWDFSARATKRRHWKIADLYLVAAAECGEERASAA